MLGVFARGSHLTTGVLRPDKLVSDMASQGPVPGALVSLSAELEALGGGDTRIGDAAVYCSVVPSAEPSIVSVGAGSNHVLVRDPRCPANVPMQQAVRRYRISAGRMP